MTYVQYAVVSVPERHENASRIASQLGADLLVDYSHSGHTETHLRAWASIDDTLDGFGVVLEDDVDLCGAFEKHVEMECAAARSGEILSLYMGRVGPTRAGAQTLYGGAVKNEVPLVVRRVFHAVGLAVPTWMIPDLISVCADGAGPWDERVEGWLRSRGYQCKYTLPSHVEHMDLPSTLPKTSRQPRPSGRVAHLFCRSRG